MGPIHQNLGRPLWQEWKIVLLAGGLSLLFAVEILYEVWFSGQGSPQILHVVGLIFSLLLTAGALGRAYHRRRKGPGPSQAPPVSAAISQRVLWRMIWGGAMVGVLITGGAVYWQLRAEGHPTHTAAALAGLLILCSGLVVGTILHLKRRTR